MFPARAWGLPQLQSYCLQRWKTKPHPAWFRAWYHKIAAGSRIIFTNGLNDPWRGGSVLQNLSSNILAFTYSEGAHIYDLAKTHANATASVRAVRRQVTDTLKSWLLQQEL